MEKTKSVIFGATIIGISASLWGFDGVYLTPQLYNLDVTFVVFILHFIPFVLMNIFLYKKYVYLKTLNTQEIFSLLFVSLFGAVIGTLAIVKALFLVNFQSLSVVVLLQKLQPIFAIFLAVTFLKETLRKRYIFWATIALTAGYFLTFGDSKVVFDLGDNTFKADQIRPWVSPQVRSGMEEWGNGSMMREHMKDIWKNRRQGRLMGSGDGERHRMMGRFEGAESQTILK